LKRLAELLEVLDGTIHARPSHGMQVGQPACAAATAFFVLTRALSERQKEALALGIPIALVLSAPALRNQGVGERPKSDAQAAILGGTFGHREAVDRRHIARGIIGLRQRVVVLRDFAVRRFGEFLAIVRAPPVVRIAACVYFDPSASNPWVSSCAASTPIPPKLAAGSAALSKNGG